LSTSATTGYSARVLALRGTEQQRLAVAVEDVEVGLVGVHGLGDAVAVEVEGGAGGPAAAVLDGAIQLTVPSPSNMT
jgi:hypothetical protein